jgi:hypothetical protein
MKTSYNSVTNSVETRYNSHKVNSVSESSPVSIDARFMRCIFYPVNSISLNDIAQQSPIENAVLKTMKVPFWKISFLNGAVSFPLYIEAVKQEIIFEIVNFEIRPEFEAIRNYFEKALKKKTINIEIAVRYTSDKVLSASAKSEDIDSINSGMIDNMRFEFVKRQILKTKQKEGNKIINTIDSLLNQNKEEQKLFLSERDLVADILDVKKSRHFYN